jgi:GNAT superfamily N-acetyltransferase
VSFEVRRVPAEQTYALRQQVLRPHQTLEQMRLPGDDDPDSGFLAAIDGAGTVLGTVSLRRERCPWQPDRPDGWRLRGMATVPDMQGRGIGTEVLSAGIAHVEQHGGGLVWCHARSPARTLYERAGFSVFGDEWEDPVIGPHVRMWRDVPAPSPDPADR